MFSLTLFEITFQQLESIVPVKAFELLCQSLNRLRTGTVHLQHILMQLLNEDRFELDSLRCLVLTLASEALLDAHDSSHELPSHITEVLHLQVSGKETEYFLRSSFLKSVPHKQGAEI